MKKLRKKRTTGQDLCPGCFSFNCDPMTMSKKFSDKIHKRLAAGLCGACGHKPCTCKSSMSVQPFVSREEKRKRRELFEARRQRFIQLQKDNK